jgi:hypothetical protein
MKTRAIPNQCAHICDTNSFGHLGALGTCTRVLPPCRGFTCQATLVNLEVDSGEDTQISGDTVACGEGDKITRDNLVSKEVYLFSVTDNVTVVGNELVE